MNIFPFSETKTHSQGTVEPLEASCPVEQDLQQGSPVSSGTKPGVVARMGRADDKPRQVSFHQSGVYAASPAPVCSVWVATPAECQGYSRSHRLQRAEKKKRVSRDSNPRPGMGKLFDLRASVGPKI